MPYRKQHHVLQLLRAIPAVFLRSALAHKLLEEFSSPVVRTVQRLLLLYGPVHGVVACGCWLGQSWGPAIPGWEKGSWCAGRHLFAFWSKCVDACAR